MSDLDDTASRLVLAAERLFAEGDERSTSLRAIARAAHANAAAVHYHFGGREELARAVLEGQLGPTWARRIQNVDDVAGAGRVASADEVLAAVLRPDLELLAKLRKKKAGLARFIGRAQTMRMAAVDRLFDEQFAIMTSRVVPLLKEIMPGIAEEELRWRLRAISMMVSAMYATVPDRGAAGPFGADDPSAQLAKLVAFAVGGLGAPVPETMTGGSAQAGLARPGAARGEAGTPVVAGKKKKG